MSSIKKKYSSNKSMAFLFRGLGSVLPGPIGSVFSGAGKAVTNVFSGIFKTAGNAFSGITGLFSGLGGVASAATTSLGILSSPIFLVGGAMVAAFIGYKLVIEK
jgi:phage-related protein